MCKTKQKNFYVHKTEKFLSHRHTMKLTCRSRQIKKTKIVYTIHHNKRGQMSTSLSSNLSDFHFLYFLHQVTFSLTPKPEMKIYHF